MPNALSPGLGADLSQGSPSLDPSWEPGPGRAVDRLVREVRRAPTDPPASGNFLPSPSAPSAQRSEAARRVGTAQEWVASPARDGLGPQTRVPGCSRGPRCALRRRASGNPGSWVSASHARVADPQAEPGVGSATPSGTTQQTWAALGLPRARDRGVMRC